MTGYSSSQKCKVPIILLGRYFLLAYLCIEEVRDRVRSLEKQLDEEKEANRENRRIIAGLVQRVPELEPAKDASAEPREGNVTPSEGASKGTAPSEPQQPSQRRSWWRAFFGLE
jgi:hypothetical protein